MDKNLPELLEIARLAGWGAAEILLNAQDSALDINESGDGPVTAADFAANDHILEVLRSRLGDQEFGYLTEETYKTDPSRDRLSMPWVWVIDPLDGTKEYIQKTNEYAVHIALVHNHRPVLAIVACPAAGKLYSAILGEGTQLEQRDGTTFPVKISQRREMDDLIVVASRSHRNPRFNQLMQRFPVQTQKSIGGLGGKIAAIIDQHADIYISLSGTSAPKDWDLAAPELVLTEAGGQFTHFDGSPLIYNQDDITQWGGLLASNGTRHTDLCTAATQILQQLPAL
jgi:3'(2'), 5'-bisphosphate nucleotidase